MNTNRHTLFGLLAIILWSTTFAVSRPLTEQLGPLTAAAGMYLIGGVLGCVFCLPSRKHWRTVLAVDKRHLLGCGALFTLYATSLYLSIGLVSSRQQVIEVGLINYLWPSFTILLTIPLLGFKPRILLLPGMLLASVGVALSGSHGEELSVAGLLSNLQLNRFPYMLALTAAVSWALYSNMSRKLGRTLEVQPVPLFILATGLILSICCMIFPEESNWGLVTILELLFMAVFPTFFAYLLWDSAMRQGDMILVSSLSYSTPVLATLLSCLYLDIEMTWTLWLACGLVVAGSVLCKYSVDEAVVVE